VEHVRSMQLPQHPKLISIHIDLHDDGVRGEHRPGLLPQALSFYMHLDGVLLVQEQEHFFLQPLWHL